VAEKREFLELSMRSMGIAIFLCI